MSIYGLKVGHEVNVYDLERFHYADKFVIRKVSHTWITVEVYRYNWDDPYDNDNYDNECEGDYVYYSEGRIRRKVFNKDGLLYFNLVKYVEIKL